MNSSSGDSFAGSTSAGGRVQRTIEASAIKPDPSNRVIVEASDEFLALTDSIRVMGILSALHVQDLGDGSYQLLDGERRWRAARAVGVTAVPCEVWSSAATSSDVAAAGVVMNEHRKAHSCLSVARRLRQLKNEQCFSHEDVAHRVGIPVLRAKLYLSLFHASDMLVALFDVEDVPLKTAAESSGSRRRTVRPRRESSSDASEQER